MLNQKFYEEKFAGYSVPERIRRTAIAIMQRFTITGLCDGMYIANVIAYNCNIGDGAGNFYGDDISKPEEAAKELQSAYGCNIFKKDIGELEEIIRNGYLDMEKAKTGISEYIAFCKEEKRTCDQWRMKYLDRCIQFALDVLQNLTYICKETERE